MDWNTAYVIYRLDENRAVQEVFQTDDLKQAKYWLGYIGKPGDFLCRTPLHPKSEPGVPTPAYWSHRSPSRKVVSDERLWKKEINFDASPLALPTKQEKPENIKLHVS